MRSNATLTLFSIIMLSSLLMFNGSCKKTDEPSTSICLLTRYINIDGDVTDLSYDENNRLSRITNNDVDEPYYLTLKYNPDGKLLEETHYNNGVKELIFSFFWSGNNVTVSSIYRNNDGDWVETTGAFVYELDSHGQVTRSEAYEKQDNGNLVLDSYDLFEWSNGNITKTEDWHTSETEPFRSIFPEKLFPHYQETKVYLSSVDGDIEKYLTTTYQYDDKNNSSSSQSKTVFWATITKNNVTKEIDTFVSEPETSLTTTYTYEYNEHGYPTVEYVTSPSGSTYTRKYEYNCQ